MSASVPPPEEPETQPDVAEPPIDVERPIEPGDPNAQPV